MDGLKWDYTQEIRKDISGGTLLLSEPFMDDPFFKRSVCLVCSHTKDDGTFGFIVNKVTTNKVADLSEEMQGIDFDVFYGGPVNMDSLYYLHDNSTDIEGAKKIKEGVYWSGNFEQIKLQIQEGVLTNDNIRFFLGYSGWDKGQLRKEIIENSWIVSNEAVENIIVPSGQLWENTMKQMGGIYRLMAGFPQNPNMN